MVKAMGRAKIFQESDDRILGDRDIVEKVLSLSQEWMERKYHLCRSEVSGLHFTLIFVAKEADDSHTPKISRNPAEKAPQQTQDLVLKFP